MTRHRAAVGAALLLLLGAGAANAADPLATVRAFCAADGHGDRLRPRTWISQVAPLVTWPLEPAWDHVRLITGYAIGPPRRTSEGLTVEVTYTVAAEVRAKTVTKEPHTETRTYRLAPAAGNPSWRLLPPAPAPYVFENQVAADAMAAALDPEAGEFLSASAFVWQMWQESGGHLPYLDTAALPSAPQLTPAPEPRMGDVVIYFDGEQPYHVGLLDSDDVVVSATLNGGIRRTPIDAFAGDVRYFRLSSAPRPTPAGTAPRAAPPTPAHHTTASPSGEARPAPARSDRADRPETGPKR